jgi:prepilin peptidase CpaA
LGTYPLQPEHSLYLFLCVILIIAGINDLKYQKIPNLLNFSLAIIAIAFHTIFSGLEGLLFSGAGLLLGIALFIPPYAFGGMGAGDAKLMGAVGAVVGMKGVFISAVLTAIYGGIYALLLLMVYHQYGLALFSRAWAVLKTFILTRQYVPMSSPNPVKKKPRLCYGIAIALGTVTYLLLDYMGYEFF